MFNPAFTGAIEEDIRLEAKHRLQWITPANPYTTTLVAIDNKFQNKKESNENMLAIGGIMMSDKVNDGALLGNYFSLNLAFHKILNKNKSKDVLTFGSGVTYGESRLDESLLTFDDQFDLNGFSRLIPNGEQFIAYSQSNYSISSGLIYSRSTNNYLFEIGVGAFNINKPKLSILGDITQQVDIRYVYHSDIAIKLNDMAKLNFNGMHQTQGTSKETLVGCYLNLNLMKKASLNLGIYDRLKESFIPYFGINIKDYGFGLSYDITTSSLKTSPKKPQTFEISMVLKIRKTSKIETEKL
jgi:type IX secretion system PorP/SprF family membrane protein